MKVAIFPVAQAFSTSDGSLAATAETELSTKLASVRSDWTFVDRTTLSNAIQELGVQDSGLSDPDTDVKVGKLVGAHYLIIGEVVSVQTKQLSDLLGNPMGGRYSQQVRATFSVKLEDAQTGVVLASSSGIGSRYCSDGGDNYWPGAIRDAVDRAVESLLPKERYEGKILSDTEIAIPAGKKDKLVAADTFDVYVINGFTKVGDRQLELRALIGKAKIEDLQSSATILKLITGEIPSDIKAKKIEVVLKV